MDCTPITRGHVKDKLLVGGPMDQKLLHIDRLTLKVNVKALCLFFF